MFACRVPGASQRRRNSKCRSAIRRAGVRLEGSPFPAGGRSAYDQAIHQFIGWNACHAPLASCEPGEVLVQFAVRDHDERKINSKFAAQIVPRVLGTVPGITYIADQGRPRASEVVAFWPALVSREAVHQHVLMGEEQIAVA